MILPKKNASAELEHKQLSRHGLLLLQALAVQHMYPCWEWVGGGGVLNERCHRKVQILVEGKEETAIAVALTAAMLVSSRATTHNNQLKVDAAVEERVGERCVVISVVEIIRRKLRERGMGPL